MTQDYLEDFREGLDYEDTSCPLCDSALSLLGKLGRLNWFRCTGCGMEFSRES
jgi:transposase-like protein